MPIIFYTTEIASPPARAVKMIIDIIKLDVEYRYVDLFAMEHQQEWFLKVNPAHQVPALDDNGFILTDSHAIIAYLLTVYASKDLLEEYYPTDPKQRAIIDSRWHYENGMLFARLKSILLPMLDAVPVEIPLKATESMIVSVEILENFLDGKKWLAGDRITVADISTLTSIDIVQLLVPLKYYKNISAWVERARKSIPFYKGLRDEQLDHLTTLMKKLLNYDAQERWDKIHSCAKK